MNDAQYEAYQAKCQVAAKLEAEVLPGNKQMLFDALAQAGIVLVTVSFDGSGDSGQFEQPIGFDADNIEVEIPNMPLSVRSVDFTSGSTCDRMTTVHEFVETLACDFIEKTHSGWENGDGAYGEFKFSVADRTVTLEYSERYIDTNYYEHEF